ncbi:hypothetical protein AB0M29_31940 [Streptomyces sp. NPDC051976]|uniref:hypothetical protein n=1 Tax=Streptomyces sp. NPDC051976 TaxID=3154947 RepID=UPI003441CD99
MAENTEPTNTGKPEDESVLELQNLKGDNEKPEVEAHLSTSSWALCDMKPE